MPAREHTTSMGAIKGYFGLAIPVVPWGLLWSLFVFDEA